MQKQKKNQNQNCYVCNEKAEYTIGFKHLDCIFAVCMNHLAHCVLVQTFLQGHIQCDITEKLTLSLS